MLEELLPALEKVNPDVLLTNTMVIPWGAVSAMLTGKPHVWFVREFGEEDHQLGFFFPIEDVREFIRDTSSIVLTNSRAVAKSMTEDDATANVMTLYMDIATPSAKSSANGVRCFRSAKATKLLMLSFAVTEEKGQEDAVLAVAELTARGHDVELLLMGWRDQEYVARLQAIVNDRSLETCVRFEDFREDPYSAMSEADIVLVCSRKEAFGRVALEAMLLGKPVVASNAGGLPEIVRDGSTGFLYEPRNPKDLADKVEALVRDPELRASFGRKA
jgi:glycosyltransferase involved in cell wall biosynthesis